jgi:cell division protein FtsI (penicillin-binding protein 3)
VKTGGRGAHRTTSKQRQASPRESRPSLEIRSWRVAVLILVITAVGSALGLRLVFYQIVDQAWLSAKATDVSAAAPVVPLRGVIEDDAGNPLAVSDDVYAVYATPNQIIQPRKVAHVLAPLLGKPEPKLLALLTSASPYPGLASGVSQRTEQRLLGMYLPGITVEGVPNRVYPEGVLASQVLGFVDANGGQYGLEQEYDSLLSGQESPYALIRSARAEHDAVKIGTRGLDQPPDTGGTLRLSIDTYIQDVAGRELKSFVTRSGAASGTVIISNPKNGRIIAMVNYPWFNPNRYAASPATSWRNGAIFDTYEPGSTFKIVTMAAGLDEHLIRPSTAIYDPGYANYPCDPFQIHNWDYPLANGRETMTQVLQHSANVGAAYVANLLGVRRFYPYVRSFGVGSLTGIDLFGEQSGWVPLPGVPHTSWSCPNLYDNAFGQALTVTPLQLLTAANAIANGGWLMQPEVVSRIRYGDITVRRRPHRLHRVIRSKAAHTLTWMLTESALGPPGSYGEAACALVPGYQVAAKTGTANLVSPQTHAYMFGPGSTIASTLGYAPAFHPRFSVLVVIHKPRWPWPNAQWGSVTAAPLVHDLFEALFLHYHMPPRAHNASRVQGSQRAFGGCQF